MMILLVCIELLYRYPFDSESTAATCEMWSDGDRKKPNIAPLLDLSHVKYNMRPVWCALHTWN
jgi:hypothetical protein